MFNMVKEDMESHNWRGLRVENSSNTVTAGTNSVTLSWTNERSRIARVKKAESYGLVPVVFDITDATEPYRLSEMDVNELRFRDIQDTQQVTEPVFFAADTSSGESLRLYVYPTPNTQRTLHVAAFVPQAYLGDTSLSTNLLIPVRPLVLGTVWHALEDRGEELGPDTMFSEKRYREALTEEMIADSAEGGDEYELVVV
jgi:hypothetical protein